MRNSLALLAGAFLLAAGAAQAAPPSLPTTPIRDTENPDRLLYYAYVNIEMANGVASANKTMPTPSTSGIRYFVDFASVLCYAPTGTTKFKLFADAQNNVTTWLPVNLAKIEGPDGVPIGGIDTWRGMANVKVVFDGSLNVGVARSDTVGAANCYVTVIGHYLPM